MCQTCGRQASGEKCNAKEHSREDAISPVKAIGVSITISTETRLIVIVTIQDHDIKIAVRIRRHHAPMWRADGRIPRCIVLCVDDYSVYGSWRGIQVLQRSWKTLEILRMSQRLDKRQHHGTTRLRHVCYPVPMCHAIYCTVTSC